MFICVKSYDQTPKAPVIPDRAIAWDMADTQPIGKVCCNLQTDTTGCTLTKDWRILIA